MNGKKIKTNSIVRSEPNVKHRIELSPIRFPDKISTNKRSVTLSEPSAKHHIELSAMRLDDKNQHKQFVNQKTNSVLNITLNYPRTN